MIHIVEASIDDYPGIAKLHANSWKLHYRGILSDDFLDNKVETERMNVWQDRFSSPAPNQRVSIAKEEDGIVGFACLFLDDDPIFGSLIDNLHVVASRQKIRDRKTPHEKLRRYHSTRRHNKKDVSVGI